MEQMENSINKMQNRHRKNIIFVKEDNAIKTQNNFDLMDEINSIREENKSFNEKLKELNLTKKKIELDIKRRDTKQNNKKTTIKHVIQ